VTHIASPTGPNGSEGEEFEPPTSEQLSNVVALASSILSAYGGKVVLRYPVSQMLPSCLRSAFSTGSWRRRSHEICRCSR